MRSVIPYLLIFSYVLTIFFVPASRLTYSATHERDGHKLKLDVAIYGGPGANRSSVARIVKLLETLNSSEALRNVSLAWSIVDLSDLKSDVFPLLYDLLIMPEGESGQKYVESFGKEGEVALKRFLALGGGYIGISAGAYAATSMILYFGNLEPSYEGWGIAPNVISFITNYIGNVILVAENSPSPDLLPANITVIETNGPVMNVRGIALSLFKLSAAEKAEGNIASMLGYPMIVLDIYNGSPVLLSGPRIELSEDASIFSALLLYISSMILAPNPSVLSKRLNLATMLLNACRQYMSSEERERGFQILTKASLKVSKGEYAEALDLLQDMIIRLRSTLRHSLSKAHEYRFLGIMIVSLLPIFFFSIMITYRLVKRYKAREVTPQT